MERVTQQGHPRKEGHSFEFTDENLAAMPKATHYSEMFYDTKVPGLMATKNPKNGRIMFRYRLFATTRRALGITNQSNYIPLPKDFSLGEARAKCLELDEQARQKIPLSAKSHKSRKSSKDLSDGLLKDRTPQEQASYERLMSVLMDAYAQAAHGKGDERHNDGQDFEDQDMIRIIDATSEDFALGQAIKKLLEGKRFEDASAKRREWLGAIVYIAGAIVSLREEDD